MDEKRSIQDEYLYIISLKEYFYKCNDLGDEYIEDIKKLLKHMDKNSETRNYFFKISNYYLQNKDNNYILLDFMKELAETCGIMMFLYKKCQLTQEYIDISIIFLKINQYIVKIYNHIY